MRGRYVYAMDILVINQALRDLRNVRRMLRAAEANNAADYVARAIKSVDGARRHALGKKNRQELAGT